MGEHRIWEVDNNGKPIKSSGEIPSETANEKTVRPALAQAWRSFIDYNPDNGILAMATQLGEAIEIYNLKNDTHKVLYGPAGEPEFKTGKDGSGIPNGIMGFNDIKVTNKYIYAVFQGMKLKDELAAYKQGKELEDGGRFIYVFDLKGNPVHNTAVKELYLKQITGKDSPNKNIPKTTAETTKTEIDFGTFDKSEVKETTIEIKNTGDNPLVIVDVSTTCGCTAATYDKRPAKPGETLRVGIKMTPKDTGFFDEVVTIKYNSLNNQHVKLKIKGNVR